MTYDQLRKIVNGFNELNTDIEKYRYLLSFDDRSIFVFHLDNDGTYIDISDKALYQINDDDQIENLRLSGFDSWIGNGVGAFDLLEALGFEVEGI